MTLHDVTARKVHQWAMVALVALAFLLPSPYAGVTLGLAGLVMLVGRFWWPADVFRQLVWRFLEPARIVRRVEREEDHETRRIARILGGAVWLLAAGLLIPHLGPSAWIVAWILAFAIAIMVALDAAVDFCALCFVLALVRK